MENWTEHFITDLADILNHKRIPLSSGERAKRQGKYPYYGASGIIDHVDGYIFEGEHVLISEDGENLKSRKTPIAFLADGKFWVNNHAHIVKGKSKYLNKLIVYYLESTDLHPFLTGAVQPKLNKENLVAIPFFLPENEDEQKAITNVLSSLDDKIDLLHKQNQKLEELAGILYRQWFIVEANPEGDEVFLSDVADHHKNNIKPFENPLQEYFHYSIPAFDDGQNPQIELGDTIRSNKYQVLTNSILISKLNPRFPRVWQISKPIDEEVSICSTEFQVVVPHEQRWFPFIYYFLKSRPVTDELIGAAGGTSGSHQRVSPEDIFNLSFIKPDDDRLNQFYQITSPNLEKINNNWEQIQKLEKLRNTLLPKLMSGEVRVKM